MDVEAPFFQKLRGRLDSLPPNQRTLASYIFANYQAVAFSNISQLSKLAGVSTATIVRFSRAFGFDGYPALQREIRRLVRADLKGTDRYRLAESAERSTPASIKATIEKEMENISGLADVFDQAAFDKAAATLESASEIVVSASRSAVPLASHLCFVLNKIGIGALLCPTIDFSAYERLGKMDARGCAVFIGFPRYVQDQVRLLAYARNRPLRTLSITDSPFSPLQADVNLYTPAESASFIAFHCAPFVLLNALLHAVARANEKQTLAALKHFENLAESTGYFHTAGRRRKK